MLHNIQIENAFNCVLKGRLIAVGPFSHNKLHVLGNYYDLYKYHEVCTNQLTWKRS